MSSITLNGSYTGAVVTRYLDSINELSTLINQMNDRRTRCGRMGKDFSAVCRALDTTINKLDGSKKDIGLLKDGFVNIVATYTACELKLAGIHAGPGVGDIISTGADVIVDEGYKPDWWGGLWDLVSNIGVVGDVVSLIGGELTDDEGFTVPDGVKLFKKILEYTGEGLKLSEQTNIEWEDFLFGLKGLDESLGLASNATALDAFEAYFTKKGNTLGFTDARSATSGVQKAGEGLSSAAEWVGYAATFITNVFDNCEEYKEGDMTIGRAATETVIETGVDIGLGMVATAAAGAACVAMGFAGAPVVVVGALGAGAVWVANTACEWITSEFFGEEKDIAEVVADAVCDTAEAIGELGKGAIDAAVDAGKAVADWFNSWF